MNQNTMTEQEIKIKAIELTLQTLALPNMPLDVFHDAAIEGDIEKSKISVTKTIINLSKAFEKHIRQ